MVTGSGPTVFGISDDRKRSPSCARHGYPRAAAREVHLAAAAVVLAGWLIVRRHKQKRWVQVAEVIAIVGALLIGFGIDHLPNFEKLLEDAGRRSASGPISPSA